MRCSLFFVFSVIFLFLKNDFSGNCDIVSSFPFPSSSHCHSQLSFTTYKGNNIKQTYEIKISYYDAIQISIFGTGLLFMLMLAFLHLCTRVNYVSFKTEVNLHKKKKTSSISTHFLTIYFSLNLLGFLLLNEYKEEQIFLFIFHTIHNIGDISNLPLISNKLITKIVSGILILNIFSISITPATYTLCLIIFQIQCHLYVKRIPHWFPIILIILSNDVHLNPGPYSQNNCFNFMSWNVNSLAKENFQRVGLIEAHNTIFNYDLISICETSLNDSVKLPESLLKDYTFVHANNPANTRRGGVGLFYKNSLPVIVRKDLSFAESIVIELKFGRKKIFFTVLYRSPAFNHSSPEFQAFLANFENLYSKIKTENPFATFFTGDFNAHSQFWWPQGDTTAEGMELEELFTKLALFQLISEPTNFEPHKNPSCIDLVVTDQPNIVLDCGTRSSLDHFCHHQITQCRINFRIPPPPPFERKIWHYNRADSAGIKRSMINFPWREHLNNNTNPNWQVNTFTDIFLNIMSNFIPNETKKIVPRDPPWITKPLKTLLNRKNRLFKNYKSHGYREVDKLRLDLFRIECQQAVETAKLTYLTNLGNKVNDVNTSQKLYWKIINRVMNKCRAPKIPPVLVNNCFILNCREKAKFFNHFFSQQCKPVMNNSVLPILTYHTNKRIDHINIEPGEIISLIRKINPNKATGSDGISGQMLLLCDDSVILPLSIIFANILSTQIYPDMWKLANVTPIFKKGDKQLIKNYRPISLLPICGKILEKIIFNNLYSYLHGNNLITKNQSGFRPGDSTTNQLLYFVDEIHKAFDSTESLEVRAVFLDISKAFDKVWHKGLLFKLEQNGITGRLRKLMENYLSNRKQRVVLNNFNSEFSEIESGVPQGSVLGPLLFLIYINDLEKNIKSNIKFFADDTMLFSVIKNPDISANDLNHDLDTIRKWAYQWKLEFNPDPSKQATEVLFSCKKKNPVHPPIFFNGTAVAKSEEHKHLGLVLDTSLSFKKHINEKIIKAKKNLGAIKHLSRFLPLKTLCQMYKALVRSHLDYCDIIYHIPPKDTQFGLVLNALMEKVERIQYQAAVTITGAWQGSSRSKLYEELGWESLSSRRWFRRILDIHKIVSNKTPCYLKDKIPPYRRPALHRQNNGNTFYEIRCRSQRFMSSFFPDAISSWNNIITHFDDIPSVGVLRKHLLSLIRPQKKDIFAIHDPLGLRYLFQLRLGLSSLRYHKKCHNFVDTPSANCLCEDGIEDTDHYLFWCPFFTAQRVTLATSVIEILLKYNLNNLGNRSDLYLYGHPTINIADNRKIILSTIKYIKETRRLST